MRKGDLVKKLTNKSGRIVAYFKRLSLHEKYFYALGPIGVILYFIPNLVPASQDLGLFKIFMIVNSFGLIFYFGIKFLQRSLKGTKVPIWEKVSLFAILLTFFILAVSNLHMEKGLHIDEIWRIDRGRQFVIYNDFDYGYFRGTPINKTIVGTLSLLGVLEDFIHNTIPQFVQIDQGDFTGWILRTLLGIVPAIFILINLYVILKKKFSPFTAITGILLLALSYNFLDFSTTFLTEPLLTFLCTLLLGFTILIFDEKNSKKRKSLQDLLFPLFITVFLAKYTLILILPVVIYAFLWQRKPERSAKVITGPAIQSFSILVGLTPYLLTLDGIISFTKGPARGFLPVLRDNILNLNSILQNSLPLIIGIFTACIVGLILLFVNFKKIYTFAIDIFMHKTVVLFMIPCAIFILLGLFEEDPLIALYQYIKLAQSDLMILVFSSIGIILSFIGRQMHSKWARLWGPASIFLLVTTSYFAYRITDPFSRHIMPYLPVLVTLSAIVFQFIYEEVRKSIVLRKYSLILAVIAIAAILSTSAAQLMLFSRDKTADGSWKYEYWQVDKISTVSIKEFTEDIRQKIGPCQTFIYEYGEEFWSRYNLGGIAYYYNLGQCSKSPSDNSPINRLKVLDFYLSTNRSRQLNRTNSLGIYSKLIPLITSAELEKILTADQITNEYVKNTDADYLITKREGLISQWHGIVRLENALLVPVDDLDFGYKIYKIYRDKSTISQYKNRKGQIIEGKDYEIAKRQVIIEAFKPTGNEPRGGYPELFDYILSVGPNEIIYPDGISKKESGFGTLAIDVVEIDK